MFGNISKEDIKIFAEKCKPEPFEQYAKIACYSYQSLPLCIIDCVYSLRVQYTVTKKVVNSYRFFLRTQNISECDDTLCSFLNFLKQYGSETFNALALRHNMNQLAGRLKLDVCLEIADKLYKLLEINTLEDFRTYPKKDLLEIVLYSVKGMGSAGVNYLFMLTGDECRCKFDTRMKSVILSVLGKNVTDKECQYLLECVVSLLQKKYKGLTVRMLDYWLWENAEKFKSF